MSIQSSPFGGVVLTGDDAEQFRRQVACGNANKRAKQSIANGMLMARELQASGLIRLNLAHVEGHGG